MECGCVVVLPGHYMPTTFGMLQFLVYQEKQRDSDSYSSTFTRSHWPEGLGKVNIVHLTLRTQVAPGTEPRLAQTQDVQVFNGIVFQFRQHVFTVVEDVGIKSSLHISSLPGPSSKLVLVSLVLVSRYLFFLQSLNCCRQSQCRSHMMNSMG